jgi:alpha-ketoglutaric semialdehyde dehydrogenase
LEKEIFGPTTLLVHFGQKQELLKAALALDGQLTVTIHADENDMKEVSALLSILEKKTGRLIFNGFPTGVEVSPMPWSTVDHIPPAQTPAQTPARPLWAR